MSIPSFTAEASLYKTSAHYWTGRSTIDLRTQPNSAIYPAMMNEGTYTPNGCAPGKFFWGQIDGGEYGVDWGCVDNPVDGWGEGSSGGTGEGQPYGGGGGGGGSSGGKGKGKPQDNTVAHICTRKEYLEARRLFPDYVNKCNADIEGSVLYCYPDGELDCCRVGDDVGLCTNRPGPKLPKPGDNRKRR